MREIVWKRMAFPHDGQDHEIIIAGVKHIAPLEFWVPLTETIDKFIANDWPVHMEGVREVETDSWLLKRRIANAKVFTGLSRLMHGVDGLIGQGTVVEVYRDYLTNNDLTLNDMLKMSPIYPWWTLTGVFKTMFDYMFSNPDIRASMVEAVENVGSDPAENTKQRRKQNIFLWLFTGIYPHVLKDVRNAVAAYGAMQERETTLLVWGAAHVPGIVEILKENGYIEVDSDHGAW